MILFVSTGIFAQASGRANFGNYPADYPLAYVTTAGFSKQLTVRTLFGPNAYFATSIEGIEGIPAIVTLESTNGAQGRFTAQLLLALKVPEKGDVKVMRWKTIT
jgi:hypothetical protein